jgi:myo-inositol 2-dehydrogenase/D-chiro-inositol 1-dehydrogenase
LHARTLKAAADLCDFTVIADVNLDVAAATAARYNIPAARADSEAVLADPAIDAVIIASSTETHAAYIEIAARHGKDIFTEKPIALDLDSTDRALAAVADAGVRLQVGFQRRFDAGYAVAKRSIEAGELGKVEMIRDAMRDPEPPPIDYLRRSGGIYRDMTIHNFDAMRWLMGEEPVEVHAIASALVSEQISAAGDYDTSIVTMRFASGALASIENSRRSGFGYDVRTEVFGSSGALMVGDSRATPIRRFTSAGVMEDHQHFFLARFRDAYVDELLAFLTAIRNDEPVAVTGQDGRAALALAYAAEESVRAGRPVTLTT